LGEPEQESIGSAGFEALRSIAESSRAMSTMLSVQTTELRSLMKKVDDVQERVIRLEEQRHGRDIDRLGKAQSSIETRLAAIELAQASMVGKLQGAGTLAAALKNYFPIVAMAVAAFFWLSGYKIEK
jgi:hypothetical protein